MTLPLQTNQPHLNCIAPHLIAHLCTWSQKSWGFGKKKSRFKSCSVVFLLIPGSLICTFPLFLLYKIVTVFIEKAENRIEMHPFTSSQWKELEQQALIFKYLASGLAIPSDLIMPIKKSLLMDLSVGPSVASPAFGFLPLHTPSGYGSPEGWGCFQTGFVRRVEDPEPGRCRRTDGKKWRCSREAYGDSKYCERHMHRGKNRSRKLVELSLATANTSTSHSTASGTHHLHSSPYSPYSSLRTQTSSTGMALSLGDDNHRLDGAAKQEPGERKWCIDQFGAKGYGNGLTMDLTMDAKSNPIAVDNVPRPSSFHSFFN